MSIVLDGVLASVVGDTVAALSGESVATLLYALSRIERQREWLDLSENPLDEITTEDWDTIEKLVGKAAYEIMTLFRPFPVGAGMMWYDNTIPNQWLVWNGSAVSRETYAELFELWGVQFGAGDGSTTFNLPDMRDRSPMGVNLTVGLGDAAGENTHTLTEVEMPAHSHRQTINGLLAWASGTTGGGFKYAAANSGVTLEALTEGAGSGLSHNNIHPVRGVHFIVFVGVDT